MYARCISSPRQVSALAESGDMVLTLGAGRVSHLARMAPERVTVKQTAVCYQQTA